MSQGNLSKAQCGDCRGLGWRWVDEPPYDLDSQFEICTTCAGTGSLVVLQGVVNDVLTGTGFRPFGWYEVRPDMDASIRTFKDVS